MEDPVEYSVKYWTEIGPTISTEIGTGLIKLELGYLLVDTKRTAQAVSQHK
jgi:hypothetical protein